MQLFKFVSGLDSKTYEVSWDPDAPRLRVTLAPTEYPPAPLWPSPPSAPSVEPVPNDRPVGLVCAYEEGRLAHPSEQSPYKDTELNAAWLFGRAFNA